MSGTNTAGWSCQSCASLCFSSFCCSCPKLRALSSAPRAPCPQHGEDLTWKLFFSPLLWLSTSRALWLSWGVCERGGLQQDRSTRQEEVRWAVTLGAGHAAQECPAMPRGAMGQCCHHSHPSHCLTPALCPRCWGALALAQNNGQQSRSGAGFGLNPHQPGQACPAGQPESWTLGFSKLNLGWRAHSPANAADALMALPEHLAQGWALV